GDSLRLEVGRRRGARPYYVRQEELPVLRGVARVGMVVERPRAARVESLRHHHETGPDAIAVERRVRTEVKIERLVDRLGREPGDEDTLSDERTLEYTSADLAIERLQVGDR